MLREYAARYGLGLWDALCHYCDKHGLESEVASSLLNKQVLADIKIEVEELNLLKKRGRKSARLPL